jgi:hypothetical protein
MLKSVVTLILFSSASIYAAPAASCNILEELIFGCPTQPQPTNPGRPGTTAMPEPSAISELVVFAGAIGLIAWRQRRRSDQNVLPGSN